MSELQFAKQFLTTIDNKPTKYQPDHIFDPKTFPLRVPYTLPRLQHPPHPSPPTNDDSASPPPGAAPSETPLTLTLKSNRNPNMSLTLPSLTPSSTTISSLKEAVQLHLGGSSVVNVDKIKILYNKKPIPPSKKTLSDALDGADTGKQFDLAVMVMGGAPDPPSEPPTTAPVIVADSDKMEDVETQTQTTSEAVQPGEVSGKAVLEQSEFWDDLQGFLGQRIKDEAEAGRLRGVFERAWRSAESGP